MDLLSLFRLTWQSILFSTIDVSKTITKSKSKQNDRVCLIFLLWLQSAWTKVISIRVNKGWTRKLTKHQSRLTSGKLPKKKQRTITTMNVSKSSFAVIKFCIFIQLFLDKIVYNVNNLTILQSHFSYLITLKHYVENILFQYWYKQHNIFWRNVKQSVLGKKVKKSKQKIN